MSSKDASIQASSCIDRMSAGGGDNSGRYFEQVQTIGPARRNIQN